MIYVIRQYNMASFESSLVSGRYPEVFSCSTLNSLSTYFINLLIKLPHLSVRLYLGVPYWEKRVVANTWAWARPVMILANVLNLPCGRWSGCPFLRHSEDYLVLASHPSSWHRWHVVFLWQWNVSCVDRADWQGLVPS